MHLVLTPVLHGVVGVDGDDGLNGVVWVDVVIVVDGGFDSAVCQN